ACLDRWVVRPGRRAAPTERARNGRARALGRVRRRASRPSARASRCPRLQRRHRHVPRGRDAHDPCRRGPVALRRRGTRRGRGGGGGGGAGEPTRAGDGGRGWAECRCRGGTTTTTVRGLFEARNPWNTDVSALPASPASPAIIAALAAAGGWGNGNVFQIDF